MSPARREPRGGRRQRAALLAEELATTFVVDRMPRLRRVPPRAARSELVSVFAPATVGRDALDGLPAELRRALEVHLDALDRDGGGARRPADARGRRSSAGAGRSRSTRSLRGVSSDGLHLQVVRPAPDDAGSTSAGAGHVPVSDRGAPAHAWVRGALVMAREVGAASVTLVALAGGDGVAGEAGPGRAAPLFDSRLRLARAIDEGLFRFDAFRDARKGAGERAPELEVKLCGCLLPGSFGEQEERELRRVIARLGFARALGNVPANIATPEWIAGLARRVGRDAGLRVEVWGPDRIRAEGLGGLAAVGGGSVNGPRLVRLSSGGATRSASAEDGSPPRVALVGKGVTFDSGGLSIKPAASMEEMKYDKCGACTVLALGLLLADLEVPIELDVLLPLAENLPDAAAYRPSDILEMADGTTVEVINTDAEGRLILADALALASRHTPRLLLEMSTLTGAAVVALGNDAAAVYTPSDRLANSLIESGRRTGERLWRLPLWSEDVERMRGVHARLRNSSERWGSANTAAAFLSQFVRAGEWAHLDIAGPAYRAKEADGREAGATGFALCAALEAIRELLRSR